MRLKQYLHRLFFGETNQKLDAARIEARADFAEIKTAVYDLVKLVRIVEERSRSIEYSVAQSYAALQYQIDFAQKQYLEHVVPLVDSKRSFNADAEIELRTDHPIAWSSQDHISPDSTLEGVTRPTMFVRNCIDVLGEEITALDLGTGGAGLIYEWAMNDVTAIGVDGSDFNSKHKLGYWPVLSHNLTTCDITKPFEFVDRSTNFRHKFDVVTMWEVLEHIDEQALKVVFDNIRNHLSSSGYFIGSVSLLEYVNSDGLPYHVTLKPAEWWEEKFAESGLKMLKSHPFNERFFCRGNGPRFQDFHNYLAVPSDGFLFVAQHTGYAPAETAKTNASNVDD